ncbi:hypothetical protein J6590_065682 [Homalodisca vitripennis]|nr:hypothetical protein J6590_065682 [Homalodisca vitripennis]
MLTSLINSSVSNILTNRIITTKETLVKEVTNRVSDRKTLHVAFESLPSSQDGQCGRLPFNSILNRDSPIVAILTQRQKRIGQERMRVVISEVIHSTMPTDHNSFISLSNVLYKLALCY